ncbi:cyclodeaminase/cyclohydrolase family protein [Pseudonocardia sp. CA-142604]|uniref:cyclodeaminase/cyclohydrolase family protein n=1 Tax=Pseudonocardia sp. CA-142604 TaxID=3240024 RepID=UPI003D8BCED7
MSDSSRSKATTTELTSRSSVRLTGKHTAGVREFVAAVGARAPVPGGGAASAVAAALAAALAEMAGRYTVGHGSGPSSFSDVVSRAEFLSERALLLADEDSHAYESYVAIRRQTDSDPVRARRDRARAAEVAAAVPGELACLALEVAGLGERLVEAGNPHLRSDACAAVLLSAAVAGSAAVLVAENLKADGGDARIAEARRCARVAAEAASRVAEALGLMEEGELR